MRKILAAIGLTLGLFVMSPVSPADATHVSGTVLCDRYLDAVGHGHDRIYRLVRTPDANYVCYARHYRYTTNGQYVATSQCHRIYINMVSHVGTLAGNFTC